MDRRSNPVPAPGRRVLATVARVLALTLVAGIVCGLGPARASTWEATYQPNWTGGGQHTANRWPSSVAAASFTVGGLLEVKTACSVVDTATAQANCYFDFIYPHGDTHQVSIRLKGHLHGVMHRNHGEIRNRFGLYGIVWRRENNGVYLPIAAATELSENNVTGTWNRDFVLPLTASLEPYRQYRLQLVATAWAGGPLVGNADVDFASGDYGINWNSAELYYFESATTSGGNRSGTQAVQEHEDYQNRYAAANALAYDTYNTGNNINGWEVTYWKFSTATSSQVDSRQIHSEGSGYTIVSGSSVRSEVTHWLAGSGACANRMHRKSVAWTEEAKSGSAASWIGGDLPECGWEFLWPSWLPGGSGPNATYVHTLQLANYESQPVRFGSLSIVALAEPVTHPSEAPFLPAAAFADFDPGDPAPSLATYGLVQDVAITPGSPAALSVQTPGDWRGKWIYAHFSVLSAQGTVLSHVWVGHEVQSDASSVDPGSDPTPPAGRQLTLTASPNPFNPATVIQYTVPSAGAVRLDVYDLAGRRLVTLHDGFQEAGTYSLPWDVGRHSRSLASGVYRLVLRAGGATASRSLVLVK